MATQGIPHHIHTDSPELSGLYGEILNIFSSTERMVASHQATADDLHDYAKNLADIRRLLGELAGLCAGAREADNCRALARQCMDLEGIVKELRNDLCRPQV